MTAEKLRMRIASSSAVIDRRYNCSYWPPGMPRPSGISITW
jgi:hypothetical protein